jgi:hypothetical protein
MVPTPTQKHLRSMSDFLKFRHVTSGRPVSIRRDMVLGHAENEYQMENGEKRVCTQLFMPWGSTAVRESMAEVEAMLDQKEWE